MDRDNGLTVSTICANPLFFIVVDKNIGIAVTKNKTNDKSVELFVDESIAENPSDNAANPMTKGKQIR